ncbi:MAG TPA: PDZ domain-containing protein, partial [Acidimicrobiales bacterium]|nr:PDZ domain-containing protein [Acidimicrobiales bacterium]
FLRLLAQRLVNGSSGHGWLQFAACSPTAPNTPCGGRLVPYGVVTVVNVALHGASSGRIRTGDRVVSINSVPVTSAAEIGSAEYTSSPGQVVNIAVSRNGRTIDLNVRLAAHP